MFMPCTDRGKKSVIMFNDVTKKRFIVLVRPKLDLKNTCRHVIPTEIILDTHTRFSQSQTDTPR